MIETGCHDELIFDAREPSPGWLWRAKMGASHAAIRRAAFRGQQLRFRLWLDAPLMTRLLIAQRAILPTPAGSLSTAHAATRTTTSYYRAAGKAARRALPLIYRRYSAHGRWAFASRGALSRKRDGG